MIRVLLVDDHELERS